MLSKHMAAGRAPVVGWLLCFAALFVSGGGRAEDVRVHLLSVKNLPLKVSGYNLSVNASSPYKRVAVAQEKIFSFDFLTKDKKKWQVESGDYKTKLLFPSRTLKLSGSFMHLQGVHLPNTVFLVPNEKEESVDVVASVDMEKYLYGVLSSEMPVSWPLEALKAQAVATRSYTLHALQNRNEQESFDLRSSVLDQVFRWPGAAPLAPLYRQKLLKAIRSTQGLFLKLKGQQGPMKAYYHADCGGKTELAAAVWGGAPDSGTNKDVFCPQSPLARWSYKVSIKEFSRRFHEHFGESTMSNLTEFAVISKSPSGRAHYLQLVFSNQARYRITGQKLREILGFSRVKSTDFKFKKKADFIRFTGKGHGHGVGLCQWGSKALALRGKSYIDILRHYYPKSLLVKRLKSTASPSRDLAKQSPVEQELKRDAQL